MKNTDLNKLFIILLIYTYVIFALIYKRVKMLDMQDCGGKTGGGVDGAKWGEGDGVKRDGGDGDTARHGSGDVNTARHGSGDGDVKLITNAVSNTRSATGSIKRVNKAGVTIIKRIDGTVGAAGARGVEASSGARGVEAASGAWGAVGAAGASGASSGSINKNGPEKTGGAPSDKGLAKASAAAPGARNDANNGKAVWKRRFYILAAAAFVLRIAFSASIEGFPTDMGCFKGWSQAAARNFIGLYDRGGSWFIDYPPGYLYILYLLEKIRELFRIATDSKMYTTLIKLPSILADVACGAIVYYLSGKADLRVFGSGILKPLYKIGVLKKRTAPTGNFAAGNAPAGSVATGGAPGGSAAAGSASAGNVPAGSAVTGGAPASNFTAGGACAGAEAASSTGAALSERSRLLMAALYFFNPVVFFISTIWGQVDSFLTLIMLLGFVFFLGNRYYLSGAFFALAVVVKPQGIIVLPVVFFMLLHRLLRDRDFRPMLKMIAAALASGLVVILPFSIRNGPLWIVDLYSNTLTGYKLAAMNAFNFFALTGANWKNDSNTLLVFSYAVWGMIAIVAFTLLTGLFVFRAAKNRRVSDKYTVFISAAMLLFSVVTFGHRMHERYFFPVLLFLLLTEIFRIKDTAAKSRQMPILFSYAWITLSGFLNILIVFTAFYTHVESDFYDNNWIYVVSALNVAAAIFIWINAFIGVRSNGAGPKAPHPYGAGPKAPHPNSAGPQAPHPNSAGSPIMGEKPVRPIRHIVRPVRHIARPVGHIVRPVRHIARPVKCIAQSVLMAALSFSVFLANPGPARTYAADLPDAARTYAAALPDAARTYAAVAPLAAPFLQNPDIPGQPVAINNPGFEEGSGGDARLDGVPGWLLYDYREDMANQPGVSKVSFDTENYYSGAASIRIESYSINDVRYYQYVPVEPNSVYRISCRIKTESVGDAGIGANVSIYGLNTVSDGLKGTHADFERVELYGKTGPSQTDLPIAIGLGFYSNECNGVAWFDDVVAEKLKNAPAGVYVADFDTNPKQAQPNDVTSETRVLLLLIIVVVLAFIVIIALKKKDMGLGPEIGARIEDDASDSDVDGAKTEFDRKDAIIMAAMTVIYLVMALFRLGGFTAPQTYWAPSEDSDSVVFRFNEPVYLKKVFYNGNVVRGDDSNSAYFLYAISDNSGNSNSVNSNSGYSNSGDDGNGGGGGGGGSGGNSESFLFSIEEKSFYEWLTVDVAAYNITGVRLEAAATRLPLNEIAFFGAGADGKDVLLPVSIDIDACSLSNESDGSVYNLIDEQDTVPERPDVLNSTYFDEIYFARTAYENIHSLSIYETTHPPLGKMLIALGILIFGMNPFGWRIMGALAGAAMIPVMYVFAKKLFGRRAYAFCAAFLMMFDFMHFAQTRFASIDSFATLLIIIMYMFMLDSFVNGIEGRPLREVLKPLAFSGLAFGLGISVKWIALYAGAGLAFLFVLGRAREIVNVFGGDGLSFNWLRRVKTRRAKPRHKAAAVLAKEKNYLTRLYKVIAACVVFFILIPGLIYLLSYIPYIKVPENNGGLFNTMLNSQKYMFSYHSKLTDTHPFESIWWKWPLDVKPIWYYNTPGLDAAHKAGVVSFGNPLIWWTGIPCLIAAFILAFRKADRRMALVLTAFLFQFAPWCFITRATFIYHYFSSVPFLILAIVYIIRELTKTKVISFRIVGAYLAATAILFVVYYPVLSGLVISRGYSDALRFFTPWLW